MGPYAAKSAPNLRKLIPRPPHAFGGPGGPWGLISRVLEQIWRIFRPTTEGVADFSAKNAKKTSVLRFLRCGNARSAVYACHDTLKSSALSYEKKLRWRRTPNGF